MILFFCKKPTWPLKIKTIEGGRRYLRIAVEEKENTHGEENTAAAALYCLCFAFARSN
jgi:hypothetical protein